MALYEETGAAPSSAMNLIFDSRYTVPVQDDIAVFLQDGGQPMLFGVPVSPFPGETGITVGDTASAHLIASYPDPSQVFFKINGVTAVRTITTTIGGILVSTTGSLLIDPDDNLCHLRVEGIEAVAGAQVIAWTAVPLLPGGVRVLIGYVVPVAPAIVEFAEFVVQPRVESIVLAGYSMLVRSLGTLIGAIEGKLLVGVVFIKDQGAGSFNIAHAFITDQPAGTVEVYGFAIFDRASGTLEIYGTERFDQGAGQVNIAVAQRTDTGIGSFELGHIDVNSEVGGVVNVLGDHGTSFTAPIVVFRTSSLPRDLYTELEQAGIKFKKI